jgi:hypothetical protein
LKNSNVFESTQKVKPFQGWINQIFGFKIGFFLAGSFSGKARTDYVSGFESFPEEIKNNKDYLTLKGKANKFFVQFLKNNGRESAVNSVLDGSTYPC